MLLRVLYLQNQGWGQGGASICQFHSGASICQFHTILWITLRQQWVPATSNSIINKVLGDKASLTVSGAMDTRAELAERVGNTVVADPCAKILQSELMKALKVPSRGGHLRSIKNYLEERYKVKFEYTGRNGVMVHGVKLAALPVSSDDEAPWLKFASALCFPLGCFSLSWN